MASRVKLAQTCPSQPCPSLPHCFSTCVHRPPHPGRHPGIRLRPSSCRVLTLGILRHTYFCLAGPWRMQGQALSHWYLCAGSYPLPVSQGSMCLNSSCVWVYKVEGSPGMLSDTVNLDIFLHRRLAFICLKNLRNLTSERRGRLRSCGDRLA